MDNLVQKFLEARLIGGNSEFVANVEKAENMVWEATGHDVRVEGYAWLKTKHIPNSLP